MVVMFLQHKKHKVLSKLIAFTFMLNTLTPVAFAEEVTAETNVTAEATAKENTVTTNNLNTVRTNNSGQLSLNSVQTDVLNRIAQSEAQAFKNKNLNITDEEINSLMNIPLSTTDDVEYYTQEEKDYVGSTLTRYMSEGHLTYSRAYYLNLIKMIAGGERRIGCIFTDEGLFIHPSGRVYRCWAYDKLLGNIKKNTISDIWKINCTVEQLENIKNKCRNCYNNCYINYKRIDSIRNLISV